MYSSDDDDFPEDISFQHSKEEALKDVVARKETLQREKDAKKKLRQAFEQRNIDQKKRKTLPQNVLEQADEALKQEEAKKRKLESQKKSDSSSDQEDSDNDKIEEETYVIIGKTKQFNKPISGRAVDFRQQRLYGGNIHRVTSKQSQQLMTKRMIAKRS